MCLRRVCFPGVNIGFMKYGIRVFKGPGCEWGVPTVMPQSVAGRYVQLGILFEAARLPSNLCNIGTLHVGTTAVYTMWHLHSPVFKEGYRKGQDARHVRPCQ